ncbi:MAG: hypothetical protein J0L70_26540 [Leptolyngbya sp. UWPOB_LEPTO1]|uniref:hypothetical protein n=1 Tax=Leptolyngbya sp. UWPOB_LEPTO1 TaxID=2815653 RepID=UPI001ACBE2A9|nr:hypothetical protein [Leptolyngbya sp. UWPOB_LEPTO1]MBN8564099.1 hypothetical protein [Leptolyngbya sp. UWPOB_LEPTO1]
MLSAFRHHRLNHLEEHFPDGKCSLCSTPFGITDQIASPKSIEVSAAAMCSTPFGITDQIASKQARLSLPPEKCSTPFGITDQIAFLDRALKPEFTLALNAFRHHRSNRCHNSNLVTQHIIVLNAFRHHRSNRWVIQRHRSR